MNVYHYIADSNPHMAKAVCHSMGYKVSNVRNEKDLGECLRQIVANEGEVGFRKVMEHHPDKDVLLELFSMQKDSHLNCSGEGCSCRKNQASLSTSMNSYHERYMSFDGIEQQRSASSQTNTFIIAAALILAVAVISQK